MFLLTIIESPFAGDVETHILYARRAMKDSIKRGEAPFASHLLYTQEGILDDQDANERRLGMFCGWAWMQYANQVAVYTDYGISLGMSQGIERVEGIRLPLCFRKIGKNS